MEVGELPALGCSAVRNWRRGRGKRQPRRAESFKAVVLLCRLGHGPTKTQLKRVDGPVTVLRSVWAGWSPERAAGWGAVMGMHCLEAFFGEKKNTFPSASQLEFAGEV